MPVRAFTLVPDWTGPEIGALAVAIVAASGSLYSTAVAHRAYTMARAQNSARDAPLDPYLEDSYRQRDVTGQATLYAFLLSITNRADAENCISNIVLRIRFEGHASELAMVDIPSLSRTTLPPSPEGRETLAIPQNMAPRSAVSGWVKFRVPDTAVGRRAIDVHEIRIGDSRGQVVERKVAFIKEVFQPEQR